MKKLFFTLLTICFTIMAQAQVNQTFNCSPGKLLSIMETFWYNNYNKLSEITQIKITGTMDQRDLLELNFKTRSDSWFGNVTKVDLSEVTIAAYDSYPENQFTSFYWSTLSEIILPTSITSIGERALSDSKNLTTVLIPSSVTFIGEEAFSYSPNLLEIHMPSSIDSVGSAVFLECTSLQKVTLSSSLTKLPDLFFQGCTSLTYIYVKEGITTFGFNVFKGCTSLTFIELPSTLTKTGTSTFEDCTSLQSITLPPNLSAIEDWTFMNCSSLKDLNIPSKVTYIRSAAFLGCKSLNTLTLPASLNQYRFDAFQDCRAMIYVAKSNPYFSSTNGILFNKDKTILIHYPSMKTDTSYTVPTTVQVIQTWAFHNNKYLKHITIPAEKITYWGNTFPNCSSLSSIYVKNPTPSSLSGCPYNFYNVNQSTCILYVPKGSKVLYENAYLWADFEHIIEIDTISLSANTVLLPNYATDTAQVSVSTDSTWIANSDQSWLTITPDKTTKGNGKISFNAEVNTNPSTRTAIVTVTIEGVIPQNIIVTQEAAIVIQDTALVTPDTVLISEDTVLVLEDTVLVSEDIDLETQLFDIITEKVDVFPNPTKDRFGIHGIQDAVVKIYALSGELLITENISCDEMIMLNNLKQGFYIVKIFEGNKFYSRVLIVQ